MGAFFLALINPHYFVEGEVSPLPPAEGLAIYFVLDHSGSMGKPTPSGETKLDLLKQIVTQWTKNDFNNLIGIVAFARKGVILSPLTLDRNYLENQLKGLNLIQDKAEDGTAIGYAIYKTAHLISSSKDYEKLFGKDEELPYNIKSAAIILITDGLQDPHPLDLGDKYRSMELLQAAAYAKEQGIRVYIVNVEPRLNLKEFEPNKKEMEKVAEVTGGKLYVVEEFLHLEKTLKDIRKGEMSRIGQAAEDRPIKKISFYPSLIATGLVFMGISLLLQTTVWRQMR